MNHDKNPVTDLPGPENKRYFIRRHPVLVGLCLVLILFVVVQLFKPRRPPWPQPLPNYSAVNLPGKYEGRLVELYIGNTHFKLAVDYLNIRVPEIGGGFLVQTAWPSMRSLDEEIEVNKNIKGVRLGESFGLRNHITLHFHEAGPTRRDSYTSNVTEGKSRKELKIERLDELGLFRRRLNDSVIEYWAIDENVKTPFNRVPFYFECANFENGVPGVHKELKPLDPCNASFKVNDDCALIVRFHYELLIDWKEIYFKVLDFIKLIEVDKGLAKGVRDI